MATDKHSVFYNFASIKKKTSKVPTPAGTGESVTEERPTNKEAHVKKKFPSFKRKSKKGVTATDAVVRSSERQTEQTLKNESTHTDPEASNAPTQVSIYEDLIADSETYIHIMTTRGTVGSPELTEAANTLNTTNHQEANVREGPESSDALNLSSMHRGLPTTGALRIVLVGKTGVGKSASGNTILGREEFESEVTPSSVTAQCLKRSTEVDGRKVCVVDTPGLYDTKYSKVEIIREIARCICLSSPGPHAFLVTIQLGRFTEEEQATVKMIQQIFGKESSKYTMVLFSHGDKLKKKTIEEFLSQSKELADFTDQCRGRYHVFNNETDNRSQVKELLEKIDKMVTVNGGRYYTNDMFLEAENEIEKEKERILQELKDRERPALEKQLKDKDKVQEALDELVKKNEQSAREKAERNNAFIQKCTTVGAGAGSIAGAVVGGLVGCVLGPFGIIAGIAIGAAGGAGIGAGIGAGVGAAAKCTIQ